MYDYSWGDEDVESSSIRVINDSHEMYTVTFVQEAWEKECFSDIIADRGELLNKEVHDEDDNRTIIRTITLKIRAVSNPPPETIFKIVDQSESDSTQSPIPTIYLN